MTPLDWAVGSKNKKLIKDAGGLTSLQLRKKFKLDIDDLTLEEKAQILNECVRKEKESKEKDNKENDNKENESKKQSASNAKAKTTKLDEKPTKANEKAIKVTNEKPIQTKAKATTNNNASLLYKGLQKVFTYYLNNDSRLNNALSDLESHEKESLIGSILSYEYHNLIEKDLLELNAEGNAVLPENLCNLLYYCEREFVSTPAKFVNDLKPSLEKADKFAKLIKDIESTLSASRTDDDAIVITSKDLKEIFEYLIKEKRNSNKLDSNATDKTNANDNTALFYDELQEVFKSYLSNSNVLDEKLDNLAIHERKSLIRSILSYEYANNEIEYSKNTNDILPENLSNLITYDGLYFEYEITINFINNAISNIATSSDIVIPKNLYALLVFDEKHFDGKIIADYIDRLQEILQHEEMELYDDPGDFQGGDYWDEDSDCDEDYTLDEWVEDQTKELRDFIEALENFARTKH